MFRHTFMILASAAILTGCGIPKSDFFKAASDGQAQLEEAGQEVARLVRERERPSIGILDH